MARRTTTMTVTIPAGLAAKLTRLAKRRKIARSEIVRAALDLHVGGGRRSFTEVAAEFCGAAQGPGNLSTDRVYLDGFGE